MCVHLSARSCCTHMGVFVHFRFLAGSVWASEGRCHRPGSWEREVHAIGLPLGLPAGKWAPRTYRARPG